MRTMLKLALPALLALSLVACNKAAAPASSDAGAAAAPGATTASADSVGIAECDAYLNKVEACVNSKVPAAQKAAVEAGLNASRTSWKQAAAQPGGKDALAGACKQALATAKQSYGAMGCEF
jgi:hypothetical protein